MIWEPILAEGDQPARRSYAERRRGPRSPRGLTSIAHKTTEIEDDFPPEGLRIVHPFTINDDLQENSIFFFFPSINCGSV